jgi:hypothetical protein
MQVFTLVGPEIDRFFLENWGICALFPKKISSTVSLFNMNIGQKTIIFDMDETLIKVFKNPPASRVPDHD